MDWTRLSVGQVKTMLLNERYRDLWEELKGPLQARNRGSGPKPLYSMAHVLAAVSIWHALSEGETPENIDIGYLEANYHLRGLLWEPQGGGPRHFAFTEYFANGSKPTTARVDEPQTYQERAVERLEKIKERYAQIPFQRQMTVAELLDRMSQWVEETAQSQSYIVNTENDIRALRECLSAWLQDTPETALPKDVDKGAPELKEQLDHTFAKDVCELMENGVKQFIFTGAPGTGKTYVAELLARYLGDLQNVSGKEKSYTMVQFHPSYDYTDFVEGLRPVQRDGQNPFAKLDGTFKAFCRWVVEHGDSAGRYFFLIDEINRAELSKVFGELMYCLESDKRGKKHKINTQYQNLRTYDPKEGEEMEDDVFSDGFYIPENVYIIGTMNDIDRSVESMDFALRRRFNFVEAVVDEDMLKSAFTAMGFGDNAQPLTDRVGKLNEVLEREGAVYGLNRQYFIAHGQFANLPASREKTGPLVEIVEYVWTYRLETLLREYLRGTDEESVKTFVKSCKKAFWPEDVTHEPAETKG